MGDREEESENRGSKGRKENGDWPAKTKRQRTSCSALATEKGKGKQTGPTKTSGNSD